jgi:hypothetical protein
MAKRRAWASGGVICAIAGATIAACSHGDVGGTGSTGTHGDTQQGAQIYASQCASCHGVAGEGGVGPALDHESKSLADLAALIDATMPQGDPSRCDGDCPINVAQYILDELGKCSGDLRSPRRLRLLTRREYNATVRDLFGGGSAQQACSTDEDCDVVHESCVAGSCQKDPCELHTFVYPADGKQHTTVHVAGTFNNWPGTIAAGGWPMKYLPKKGLWALKKTLADAEYQYKLVLDEATWVADPQSSATAPDGFGGVNSVLTQKCQGTGGAATIEDIAKGFPVESRPKGFAFDDNADAGLVTSVHVEQYMQAAELLAKRAISSPTFVTCNPANDAMGCARKVVGDFGRRAFRRPLSDAEVGTYAALITSQADFTTGVSVALQVMLSSPYFLYRFEIGEQKPDGSIALTPYERASALSYFFWGTMPDEALLQSAASGGLDTADGLDKEARRLLSDPKARELIGVFAVQWLGIEPILTTDKSQQLYPEMTPDLRRAMEEETRRFVQHVVLDGTHGYDELLTANYTFANDALASLYGISGISGSDLVMANLPDGRAGVLGQASFLSTFAHSDQTSPIKRGVWVRERLLCQEFPTPPPAAGTLPPVDPNATARERFSQHSADPSCHACHGDIDSIGFGFERFDPIGRYRTTENGKNIDPSGDMNDVEHLGAGTSAPFQTLAGLGSDIVASDAGQACFAKQYYRFATGALETNDDVCALRGIDRTFGEKGHDVRELLVAIVKAPSFVNRK